ncbi:transcriptional regulator [Gephyromycinifex aptenodytis]|uniref:transcriptional regulator n=1 Tax=Gephyromycinifex aptenodytis TaxID=2716227 RepID=UPI001444CF72|nr:transcriptional regulator [Gephyromycinifex aptenodytis]
MHRRKTPPTPCFDEIIHAPHRLRLCVLLSPVESAAFATLRDELDLADSVLSKHLKVLSEAGYVTLDRPVGQGGRPRTWVRITDAGRAALAGHLAALHELSEAAALSQPPGSRA